MSANRGLDQRALFERITDAVFSFDADCHFTYLNDAAEELFDERASDVVGEHLRDVAPAATDSERYTRYHEAMETQEPVSIETYFQSRDQWYKERLYPSPDGLLVIARDITERREYERTLEATNRNLEAIIEASPVAIVGVDENLTVRLWNPAAEEMYGWAEEDVRNERLPIIPDERFAEFEDAFERVLDGDTFSGLEVTHQTADGDLLQTRVSTARADGASEDAVEVMAAIEDVTERKEREQELQRQNERLEQFVNIVSHDLRNPLTVADGHLKLAKEECDSAHLDDVARTHERMRRLIEDILQFARIGHTALDAEPIDLGALAENCWQSVPTADATLVTATGTERSILADRSLLHRLLGNLFRNAVDHGGDVVRVTIGALDDGSGFYVEDDGPGIPSDERATVFESGYSSADEGSGFGLAIVKEIVSVHDWEIRVTASDHGGARFEVDAITDVQR